MPRLHSKPVLLSAAAIAIVLFVASRGLTREPSGSRVINAFAFQERKPLTKEQIESLQSDSASSDANSLSRTWWFFRRGSLRPLEGTISADSLFPSDDRRSGDRIAKQLLYATSRGATKLKTILLYHDAWPGVRLGRDQFLDQRCPVDACRLTMERSDVADAVLFKEFVPETVEFTRPPDQLWIANLLESPPNTDTTGQARANWTASYRRDSEIVTPYEKWVHYDPDAKAKTQTRNYAKGKTKKVAWFVSNCFSKNGRLLYARELAKHIDVDIYGACGDLQCPREDGTCFQMLSQDYKFYLAFENSNCREYITEKFFVNGLGNDILPIAMGAPMEDYERAAPKNSFLHVDNFTSPADLAAYLHKLDRDDSRYNEYFQWKGTGEFIDTRFFCRLCAMLHAKDKVPYSGKGPELEAWWGGPGVCKSGSWRNASRSLAPLGPSFEEEDEVERTSFRPQHVVEVVSLSIPQSTIFHYNSSQRLLLVSREGSHGGRKPPSRDAIGLPSLETQSASGVSSEGTGALFPGGALAFLVGRSLSWWGARLPGGALAFLVGRSPSWWGARLPGGALAFLVGRSPSWWGALLSGGALAFLPHLRESWPANAAFRSGGEGVPSVQEGKSSANIAVEPLQRDDFRHFDTGADSTTGSWWYFNRGSSRPPPDAISAESLFPSPGGRGDDRITKQLMYSPRREEGSAAKLKTILLHNNGWPWVKLGREEFLNKQCPVDTCSLTLDKSNPADAVLFKDNAPQRSDLGSPSGQVWIVNMLESPLHTGYSGGTSVNWTATYMRDSEIVTPYEKWVYYDPGVKAKTQTKNYAKGKTKKVAWFVSNCSARNQRLEYARELAKHIDVDIYGGCGTLQCPREDGTCFKMLSRDYKFYLSFENSNCIDYITEKFFVNGLWNDIVPIAMGARLEDYKRAAPKNSFLHVDNFTSPADLAAYLHKLDRDDSLYNEYFQWKGTGEFIDTRFFCRICAMIHAIDKFPYKPSSSRMENLWQSPGVCRGGSWRDAPKG
ncbi:unnamed protein product [Darwinula stevensoni]|uniref:Fucosyltransferase n=1 Tax=Darwinula stevensoni TaxID=69355 RepID=A0A7R9A8C5_9CRUS|nr:unnamed protein product [Darwinula stevensoni]CAG0896296.1 unnamed protein product [Darwinula stevensoni]